MAIYGDNETSITLNKYFNAIIVTSNQINPPLKSNEHQQFQENIINSMRKNLGLDSLEHFQLVGYHK